MDGFTEELENHDLEEADTLLILHAIDVARKDIFTECYVYSPDTMLVSRLDSLITIFMYSSFDKSPFVFRWAIFKHLEFLISLMSSPLNTLKVLNFEGIKFRDFRTREFSLIFLIREILYPRNSFFSLQDEL